MKASERLLLVITLLILLALCVCIALVECGVIPMAEITVALDELWAQILVVILALCICLLAVRCMWIGLGEGGAKPAQTATLSISPTGDVRIAQEAIADFCIQTAKQTEGVQSAQCKLMQKEIGVTVLMTLTAGMDNQFVELAANVQNNIKQMLETSCGISDAQVEVLFENKAN